MTNLLTNRIKFLAIFIASFSLVLTAIYIEPFKSLDPCPMCMMQRAIFVILGTFALLAALHNPAALGARIYAAITTVTAGFGIAVASRQLWLQSLPEDRVPACGPGLDYMLDVFPLLEVIEMALRGTGDCAKVQWTFMNLSIPAWSWLAFAIMAAISLWVLLKPKQA